MVFLYNVHFYKDKNGKEPVVDYLRELKSKNNKDSQIKLRKIQDYINILKEYGTRAGEPYMKHLDGDIWELRPGSNRVLFAAWYRDSFVLLHSFVKKAQKTPVMEIDQAKRELADLIERSEKPKI